MALFEPTGKIFIMQSSQVQLITDTTSILKLMRSHNDIGKKEVLMEIEGWSKTKDTIYINTQTSSRFSPYIKYATIGDSAFFYLSDYVKELITNKSCLIYFPLENRKTDKLSLKKEHFKSQCSRGIKKIYFDKPSGISFYEKYLKRYGEPCNHF